MSTLTRQVVNPQARGRELARLGKQLTQELGSVRLAAAELLNRHRDLPCIQAYRYAAGLSQDQAAARYNEVADHQTSLGGTPANIIGPDFRIAVPTVSYGNPEVIAFSLPNPRPGQLLDLTWETFGLGIERLARQIKNLGRRLDVDVCFGINEAGLVMATFLASAQFGRCPIGYLKCNKARDDIALDAASFYPAARAMPTIVICDFEVKHADVVGFIGREIRERYPGAELYFAVFGAMTKGSDLEVTTFDDLTGARNMRSADFAAVFIAATMSPPGIEPPLELR